MAKFWESWRDWWDYDAAANREITHNNGGYGSSGTLTRHAWNAATQRAVEIVKRNAGDPELARLIKQGLDRPMPYRSKDKQ